MLPLRTVAFLLSFSALSCASVIFPILGVANYMLVYQVYPEHAWWHIPIESWGMRYSMTAALCMMAGILLNLPRLPSVRPALSLWDLCALGMVFVVILSEFIGLAPSEGSADLTDKFVKMIVFVFCLTRITTTKRNFTIVMWSLVIGSLYIGYDAWTAPRGSFSTGRLEDLGGPDFRHSSGLGAHMAAMLPLVAVTFMTTRSWLWRMIPGAAGALTVNTIVLCRTRSAFVGVACGAVVAVLLAPKKRRLRTYAAVVIAGFCAYALTDDLFWDRMRTLVNPDVLEADEAVKGRLTIWLATRQIVAEYPLGVGIGNFTNTLEQIFPTIGRRAAHNTLLLCVAELGFQGLCLFGVLVGTAIYQARQCYRRADQTSDPVWVRYMSYGLVLSIVMSFGAQMFTERLYTESLWWILALPGCLQRVVHREVATSTVSIQEGSVAGLEAWSKDNPLVPGDLAPGAFA